jgi:hypothetical protein
MGRHSGCLGVREVNGYNSSGYRDCLRAIPFVMLFLYTETTLKNSMEFF